MAEVTVAAIQALRVKTGLPMMDCKRALLEAGGDEEKAIEILRKAGAKTMEQRASRATAFGRIAVFADFSAPAGAMVELRCESAPVATNEEFVALANALAKQLGAGPGAASVESLLEQPSPDGSGRTLRQQYEEVNNRIREVFRISRLVRLEGRCGGYAHHNGAVGVLLQVEGGTPEAAKDICMHIAASRPKAMSPEEIDPELVEKEREIAREVALREGKPEKVVERIVQGKLKTFYAECCLVEQPFVKDPAKTVAQVARDAGMKLLRFIHWELPKE
jgi:elongation factor Ts